MRGSRPRSRARSTSRHPGRSAADRRPPSGPRFAFFAGKGGVGKTTCAAAAAVAAADAGRRTLVVSLDPAHSLGDALGVRLRGSSRPLGRRLRAVELDADRALSRWLRPRRDRLVSAAERGTFLDREEAGRLLDLSFPGVDELIGLLELERLSEADEYDEVVVDTAPTGHALRLLRSPDQLFRIASLLEAMQAKHRFLARRLGGRYRADAVDALIDEIAGSARRLAALLRNVARTSFTWVLVAERLALAETEDGLREIRGFGGRVARVIVNQLTPAPNAACPLCDGRRRSERDVISKLRAKVRGTALSFIERQELEPRGRKALRRLWRRKRNSPGPERRAVRYRFPDAVPRDKASGDGLAIPFPPGCRLVFFGGKGGVGKTTCAAAAALALARREPGRRILLLSVDPAHSLGDVLGARVSDDVMRAPGWPGGLRARELDAPRALAAFRESHGRVVERLLGPSSGVGIAPAFDRAVMERLLDLAPPGLDELMALAAVTRALTENAPGATTHDLVIVDSAPTGHALRLLALPELAGRWTRALLELLREYREVLPLEDLAPPVLELSRGLRELRHLIRDPVRARFVVVTRAAALPRLETERLLDALAQLRVAVGALVVDGLTPRGCGRCRRNAAREQREISALRRATRVLPGRRCTMVLAAATVPPPRGPAALVRWSKSWRTSSS